MRPCLPSADEAIGTNTGVFSSFTFRVDPG